MSMYLFGASGHGKVVYDILQLQGVDVQGFVDDDVTKRELLGLPVMLTGDFIKMNTTPDCLITIGNNRIRHHVAEQLSVSWGSAIHPTAILADSVEIGKGTTVMAGVVVNIASEIGEHVILNTRSGIDHDCQIRDFVHIAPGTTICGGVTVGEGSLIGAGAVILPNITIGKWAVIGAGAVVTRDVPDETLVTGCPAQVVQKDRTL